MHHQKSVV